MQIRVIYRDGNNIFTIGVAKSITVLDVMTVLMDECGVPIANQQLTWGRRVLWDDDPLSLYNIKTWSILWLEKIPTPPALPPTNPAPCVA